MPLPPPLPWRERAGAARARPPHPTPPPRGDPVAGLEGKGRGARAGAGTRARPRGSPSPNSAEGAESRWVSRGGGYLSEECLPCPSGSATLAGGKKDLGTREVKERCQRNRVQHSHRREKDTLYFTCRPYFEVHFLENGCCCDATTASSAL